MTATTVRRSVPLAIAALVAVGTVFVFGLFGTSDRERIEELATSTNDALCAFKGDLEMRAAANARILAENEGEIIAVFGIQIPRDVLQSNLRGQQATLKSLDSLECERSTT